jgi:hypothetical protein
MKKVTPRRQAIGARRRNLHLSAAGVGKHIKSEKRKRAAISVCPFSIRCARQRK